MEIEDLELNEGDNLWSERFANDYPEILCKKENLEILLWAEYNDEGGAAGSYEFQTDKYKFYYVFCDRVEYNKENDSLKFLYKQNYISFDNNFSDIRTSDNKTNGFLKYIAEDIMDLTSDIVNLKFEEFLKENGVNYI